MTVAELITLLQGCNPNQRVIVSGYEGGYTDVGGLRSFGIVLNVNTAWYYGPHERADNMGKDHPATEMAVLIHGANNR